MNEPITIVLGAPGEAELPLLADLGARQDVAILGVVDPTGMALGSSIAEIMGLPVVRELTDLPGLNASLQRDDAPRPLLVLPGSGGGMAASLADAGRRLGLLPVHADDLRARLFGRTPRPPAPPPAPARPGLEEIERESAALQAAIDDLEDALAGDTILRRLLDLCTGAVAASGGSIMLFDEASRELYIAYAVGLSEGTLHSTRVALGEGIAGRVARTREAQLVTGQQSSASRRRDRPDIATAVCTPLVAGDRLLGVLNVSTRAGQTALTAADRDLLGGLALRLGRILDGVQQLQRQRTSRMFDLTEQQLRRLAGAHHELPGMLAAWAETLAVTAESARVTLAVPCEDGSLLVCEGAPGETARHWYEPLHDPAWVEVLSTATPLVMREDPADPAGTVDRPPRESTTAPSPSDPADHAPAPTADDGGPLTVFYLPVGRDPVRAGLAVQFAAAGNAHAFHALAGEAVFLLERLLTDQLDHHRRADRTARLEALSQTTTALAAHEGTPGQFAEQLCAAAVELTGARYCVALADLGDDQRPLRLAGGNAPEDAPWLGELPRLVDAAGADRWRITTLETGGGPLSVLVAVATAGAPVPALVLVGKQRIHHLDGRVFTSLDAELVEPLAGLLPRAVTPVATEEPGMASFSMLPIAADIDTARRGGLRDRDQDGEERLLDDLTRELDRCDRYHNVCGLVLLRLDLPPEQASAVLLPAARVLARELRTSDRLYCLPTAELAVVVPEDVRQLDRLQERLVAGLQDQCEEPVPSITAARVAYPAAKGPAEALLQRVRDRLAPADPGSAAAR